MKIFAQGQRWISEMEPELGLGTVLHLEEGRVQLFFPASGEMRLYASENAPLIRVRFHVGDTIVDHEDQKHVVGEVIEDNNLITYKGADWEIPEALLSDALSFQTAEDRVFNGQYDQRADHLLRRETLKMHHYMRSSDVRGFLGGRIDLIPHQLFIAQEVSSRQAPRVLLSDEVGLGKTIEACLIIHRMVLSGRAGRVLIVVPESLVHQWFVELYRRFNLWFHIYDEERSIALEGGGKTQNPFFDDQFVLCSLDFLANSPVRAEQVQEAEWDMLVVDEAHHLEWVPGQASDAYTLVENLSKQAAGVLLLTATPGQLGVEGHFARLRLLDPDRYVDFDSFINENDQYEDVARIVEMLEKRETLNSKDVSLLEKRFKESDLLRRIASSEDGEERERRRLIQDLLDIHGPGRVLFRNTRSAIKGFPGRNVHLVALSVKDNHKDHLKRAAEEFSLDADSEVTFPRRLLKDDMRLVWLIEWIKQHKEEKALLICRSKGKALFIHKAIPKLINVKAAVFHEDLTLVQRDRNAAWFAEEDGAQLLISSEIGSEGRNFQFAHNLILFDLPRHPELLEQRIGRLDRIGQKKTIQIHVPYLSGSPQEVLARWYNEGLGAFQKSLVGGGEMWRVLGDRVVEITTQAGKELAIPEDDLVALLNETRMYHQKLKNVLEHGRNRLLEMNSFRPEVAEDVIKQIRAEDRDRTLDAYMHSVFEAFGIQSDEIAARTYRLKPGPTAVGAFPSIPEGGTSITFDRNKALIREDIEFITWDHPMVSGAMDLVLGTEKGNSTFSVFPDFGKVGVWIEASFVLESVAESALHVDRFLPPTPIRILVNNELEDLSEAFPEREFEKHLVAGSSEEWTGSGKSLRPLYTKMLNRATHYAEEKMSFVITSSLDAMKRVLDSEIHRLYMLKKLNSTIREVEIETVERQKKALTHAILQARIRLDSIRLIGVK